MFWTVIPLLPLNSFSVPPALPPTSHDIFFLKSETKSPYNTLWSSVSISKESWLSQQPPIVVAPRFRRGFTTRSPCMLGFLLTWSYAGLCMQSYHCGFMCAVVPSCVANSVLLQASTTFESLNLPVPFPTVVPESFWVAESDIDVLCRAEHSTVPFSLHTTCMGLRVIHHLLWKEASLLRQGEALFLGYKERT